MLLSLFRKLIRISHSWYSPDDTLDFLAQAPKLSQSAEMQLMQATALARKNLMTLPRLPLKYIDIILWHRGRSKTLAVLASLDAGLPKDPLRDLPKTSITFKCLKKDLGRGALDNAQKWNIRIQGRPASSQKVTNSQALISKRYCQYVNALSLSLDDFLSYMSIPQNIDCDLSGGETFRVLYVLSSKPSEAKNGYNIRSEAIIKNLNAKDLIVSTFSLTRNLDGDEDEFIIEQFSGNIFTDVICFAEKIIAKAKLEKSEVILGASNWFVGLAALIAARALGLPFIYEVRGFWALTRVSSNSNYEATIGFTVSQHFEVLVANNADKVFTLNKHMKLWMQKQGVTETEIGLAPNGVTLSKRVQEIKTPTKSSPFTVGFIGTVTAYEGLKTLIDAVALINQNHFDVHLKIVGDGPALAQAKLDCKKAGIEEICDFTGQLSQQEALSSYDSIDVIVVPRVDSIVTRLVEPLKVLEAMSMGAAVITSDLPPLTNEIHGKSATVTFPQGDTHALVREICRLKSNQKKLSELKEQAYKEASTRSWSHTLRELSETLKTI